MTETRQTLVIIYLSLTPDLQTKQEKNCQEMTNIRIIKKQRIIWMEVLNEEFRRNKAETPIKRGTSAIKKK